jgi:hypothetical protein
MNKERFDFLKKDYVQGFPAYCGFQVDRVAYGQFETSLIQITGNKTVLFMPA